MQSFGAEHMALIRPLPAEGASRKRNLDRWFIAAEGELRRWTWRYLYNDRWCDADREDALHWAAEKLFLRIIESKFGDEARSSDCALFRASWKNLLRSWVRSQRRTQAEVACVDENGIPLVERTPDSRAAPDAALFRLDRERREQALLASWRSWPTSATRRLVLICRDVPDEVRPEDVEAAAAESDPGQGQGLTRPAAECWSMLRAWRDRSARGENTRGRVTEELAFALRGPPGNEDFDAWDRAEVRRARNWLDQQRRRAIQDLQQRLDLSEPGLGLDQGARPG